MPLQNVSLTQPTDYSAEALAIERKRKLAEALQQQSLQPLETGQMSGGWAIPISPFQGAAKLAQAYVGAMGTRKADEDEKAVAQKYQQDLLDTVTNAERARLGSPGSPQPPAEQGGGPPQPAQAPNIALANALLMGHPATQAMGLQGMSRDMQMQQFMQAAQGAQGGAPQVGAPQPQGATPAAGGTQAPQGAPQTMPAMQSGGLPPAGGQPASQWLLVDPTGAKYMEQLAKDRSPINVRPGGTVYIPGQGAQFYAPKLAEGMTTGPGGIVQPQAGYAETRTAQSATPLLNAPMVKIPVSNQRTLDLTQPEQIRFTQSTGKVLPTRYQALAGELPGVTFSDDANNQSPAGQSPPVGANPIPSSRGSVKPSDVGVVGATQSQQEQIQQAGQTAANTEAGKEFISEMRQNYAKLRDVPATLENLERAKTLAAGEAAHFMGPFGESKLALTKFMRSNVPGMGNLKTDQVTNAEELQSTLFNQVMDNLKKMDASPSQYQQQVMQEAFGTLRTDPQSVPKILSVFADILRNRVSIHNDTVSSAERRGTTFPYDVKVTLPKGAGGLKLSPATIQFMKQNGLAIPGE